MEQRYLLDTNIAIYFLQGMLSPKASEFLKPILKYRPNISIITQIERLSWDEYPAISQQFVNECRIYPLVDNVINICVDIRKKYRIKVSDAIIAATSINYDLPLLTRNVSDFKKIQELNWVNPFGD